MSILRVGGQRLKSQEAEVISDGPIAEASFAVPFDGLVVII